MPPPSPIRYLAFGFLHFFFSSVGQTFFVSLFVARMTERMDWGDSTFASLYSGVTLVSAFILPYIGTLVDRVRIRYVSTAVAVGAAAGAVLMAYSEHIVPLVLGLFIVRFGGQGIMTLIGSTTIGRYFEERRGRYLSFSIIGISVAEVIIPPLATYAMGLYGYSPVWLMAAAGLLFVFVPAVWLLVGRYDDFQKGETVAARQPSTRSASEEAGLTSTSPPTSFTRRQVLADRRFWTIVPTVLFIPFVFTGLVFNQAVVAEQRGYTAELMAYGLSTYGAVRAVFLLFGGGLVDRVGPVRLLRFLLLPAAAGVAVLLLVGASWSVPVFFGLVAVSGGVEAVLMPTLWATRYGPRYLGGIKSMVKLLVVLSSAAAPVVFSFGLRLGLEAILGVLLVYAAGAAVGAAASGGREREKPVDI